jgi:hypothetical protein
LTVACKARWVDHPAYKKAVGRVVVQADRTCDQAVQTTITLGLGAVFGKIIRNHDLLATSKATPETYSPRWACLFLRLGGRGFHFDRFFDFRNTNRHDANSTFPLRTHANRPVQDLFPDKFLDSGQVGFGFEVTPVSLVWRMFHRFVPSTGKW